ncbi:inactive serine/threonine-protein kinase/endoribonuclease IRE1-like [Capsella rubella]|uniref:inactive serine/threonine-protein kinase/endoribonuclease IRE1-like n=1 Tax=Capsella rubella TaxID=81985 RepID=UPI000CD4F8A4|nr:inactive serine/threonine-protein kinase/endoribonuclease IRE1-like [Capsella rubella]
MDVTTIDFKKSLLHDQTSGSDLCDSDSLHMQTIRTILSLPNDAEFLIVDRAGTILAMILVGCVVVWVIRFLCKRKSLKKIRETKRKKKRKVKEQTDSKSGLLCELASSGEEDHVIEEETNAKSARSVLPGKDLSEWYNSVEAVLQFHVDQEDKEIGRMVTNKLFLSSKKIESGSHNGNEVFEGIYERRLVAVKCLDLSRSNDADKNDLEILYKSDDHSNIIRLHGFEHDKDHGYICLERWRCSLDDLIRLTVRQFSKSTKTVAPSDSLEEDMAKFNLWKAVGNPLPLTIKLMRDIVYGLLHLHKLRIMHRDLKPQNVLIISKGETLTAKISDMGICKRLITKDIISFDHLDTCYGSPGWQAPEQILKQKESETIDMFRFGCILFYSITGNHPFGRSSDRDNNITTDNKVNFSQVKHPEASHLINQLLHARPNLR